jgi:hypothetical protein
MVVKISVTIILYRMSPCGHQNFERDGYPNQLPCLLYSSLSSIRQEFNFPRRSQKRTPKTLSRNDITHTGIPVANVFSFVIPADSSYLPHQAIKSPSCVKAASVDVLPCATAPFTYYSHHGNLYGVLCLHLPLAARDTLIT